MLTTSPGQGVGAKEAPAAKYLVGESRQHLAGLQLRHSLATLLLSWDAQVSLVPGTLQPPKHTPLPGPYTDGL